MTLLAIEIGGSKLQLVTGIEAGSILDCQRMTVDRTRGGEGIRDQIKVWILRNQQRFQWEAIGVGYGGPVDWQNGKIDRSHHVAGWDDFPLRDWLRNLTGLPVAVDNDTNLAALGEAKHGAGAGMNPVFYTNSGSGVGGGLVVSGSIYHGAKPGECEFGHLRLDKLGTIVEDRCSGWAVDKQVCAVIAQKLTCILASLAAETNESGARLLAPALAANCPEAQNIIHQAAGDLAFALSHVVHLFHPEAIVLGGGLALVGEPWRAAVALALSKFVMNAFAHGPTVKLAGLGENAVPVGALLLAQSVRSNNLTPPNRYDPQ